MEDEVDYGIDPELLEDMEYTYQRLASDENRHVQDALQPPVEEPATATSDAPSGFEAQTFALPQPDETFVSGEPLADPEFGAERLHWGRAGEPQFEEDWANLFAQLEESDPEEPVDSPSQAETSSFSQPGDTSQYVEQSRQQSSEPAAFSNTTQYSEPQTASFARAPEGRRIIQPKSRLARRFQGSVPSTPTADHETASSSRVPARRESTMDDLSRQHIADLESDLQRKEQDLSVMLATNNRLRTENNELTREKDLVESEKNGITETYELMLNAAGGINAKLIASIGEGARDRTLEENAVELINLNNSLMASISANSVPKKDPEDAETISNLRKENLDLRRKLDDDVRSRAIIVKEKEELLNKQKDSVSQAVLIERLDKATSKWQSMAKDLGVELEEARANEKSLKHRIAELDEELNRSEPLDAEMERRREVEELEQELQNAKFDLVQSEKMLEDQREASRRDAAALHEHELTLERQAREIAMQAEAPRKVEELEGRLLDEKALTQKASDEAAELSLAVEKLEAEARAKQAESRGALQELEGKLQASEDKFANGIEQIREASGLRFTNAKLQSELAAMKERFGSAEKGRKQAVKAEKELQEAAVKTAEEHSVELEELRSQLKTTQEDLEEAREKAQTEREAKRASEEGALQLTQELREIKTKLKVAEMAPKRRLEWFLILGTLLGWLLGICSIAYRQPMPLERTQYGWDNSLATVLLGPFLQWKLEKWIAGGMIVGTFPLYE